MQLVLSIIINGFILTILSISMLMLYSTFRFFHLSHAISLTFGAYFVYTMLIIWKLSMWVAIPVSVVAVILLFLAINKWVYRPLQKHGAESWQMMMVSLGLYVVMQNIVSVIWEDRTLTFRTWQIIGGHEIFGAYISDVQVVLILSCFIMILGSWCFMKKTIIGKQIIAMSFNPVQSTILGMSRDKILIWCIGYGTGLAAFVGVLIAANTDVFPAMGFDWLMYGVVAMIIGGMGKMRYMILGAFLLATAQQLSAFFFDSKWMNATAYIILIIFLYFRPFGFSGKKFKKTEV